MWIFINSYLSLGVLLSKIILDKAVSVYFCLTTWAEQNPAWCPKVPEALGYYCVRLKNNTALREPRPRKGDVM